MSILGSAGQAADLGLIMGRWAFFIGPPNTFYVVLSRGLKRRLL